MSDPVTRLNAALEGRYRIERELGEGGMATVYLADDLRHERKVALKVLKQELAAVVGAERFLAEIKTTANLQHPHILPLFDSGEASSFLFYVMPYVEGETLGDRIAREKQLPVAEAVRIAEAVAGALQHAHDRGVIHRDIKPANILLQDGQPVVSDFGIALAVGSAGGARLTETGLSVGTPWYMSPEQATGDQQIGPPSDTYALAAVLYEMLTGEPPYTGTTAQAVLGRIIQGAPVSATEMRNAVPANVDAAIRKALERLPADRFTTAQGFADALSDPGFRYGDQLVASASPRRGLWNPLSVAATALAVILSGVLAWNALRPEGPEQVIRYTLSTSEGQQILAAGLFGSGVALSPDGSRLAYVGLDEDRNVLSLWLRERSLLDARLLPGTEGAQQPFFSPDGQRIGFVTAGRELKVVSLGGEPPLTLAEGIGRGGGSWGTDGYLYFLAEAGGAIVRIPAGGGEIEPVTTVDREGGEASHRWPVVLPGAKGVLFLITKVGGEPAIGVADLVTGRHEELVSGVYAQYASTGHLVYVRSDGALLAAPFDQNELAQTGPAVPLLDGVAVSGNPGADLTLSESGALLYLAGGRQDRPDELVWVSRDGATQQVDPDWREDFAALRLSPTGDRVAITIRDREDGRQDVWIKQLDRGPLSRLTFEGAASGEPVWSPDGESVTFRSNRGDYDLYTRRADGSSATELLLDTEGAAAQPVWSPDGEWLVFTLGVDGRTDIYAIRPGTDDEPVPLIADPGYDEFWPELSPDGRWIAYTSNETGRADVFVRPFPEVNTSKWPVSTNGGMQPKWSPAGGELFYRSGVPDMVAVEILPGPSFSIGEQRVLFPWSGGLDDDRWDVAPDGQRFLFVSVTALTDDGGAIIVVENFLEELRERVAN